MRGEGRGFHSCRGRSLTPQRDVVWPCDRLPEGSSLKKLSESTWAGAKMFSAVLFIAAKRKETARMSVQGRSVHTREEGAATEMMAWLRGTWLGSTFKRLLTEKISYPRNPGSLIRFRQNGNKKEGVCEQKKIRKETHGNADAGCGIFSDSN